MSEASVLQFHLGSSLAYSVEILQLSTTISLLCFITSLNLAVVMLVVGCESDGANLVICGGDYVTQVVMMIVVVKKREY